MKALMRNVGETITEIMKIPGIDWNTGYPLTASGWAGGPYILVNDYVPIIEDDFAEDPEPAAAGTQDPEAPVPVGGTVVIDGVTYTRTS